MRGLEDDAKLVYESELRRAHGMSRLALTDAAQHGLLHAILAREKVA